MSFCLVRSCRASENIKCKPISVIGLFFPDKFLEPYPPRFETQIPDKTLTHTGEDVEITCAVKAAPAAAFTWSKDNVALNIDGNK